MTTIQKLQVDFFRSSMPTKQLETMYPCKLCNVNSRCYYKEDITISNVPVYICPIAYDELLHNYDKVVLVKELCSNYLINDLNKTLQFFLHYIQNPSCMDLKIAIIKYRQHYLNIDFISLLTLEQLQMICKKRQLKIPNRKIKNRKTYIDIIQQDVHVKRSAWMFDYDYPL